MLLLAAGFRPEETPEPNGVKSKDLDSTNHEPIEVKFEDLPPVNLESKAVGFESGLKSLALDSVPAEIQPFRFAPQYGLIVALAIGLFIIVAWTLNRPNAPAPTPTATQSNEKLLLLIPARPHDDLMARLSQTLEREAASNRLADFHISVWLEPLTQTQAMQKVAESASATWIIYSSSQTDTLYLSHADMSPSHLLSSAYQINLQADMPTQLRAFALLSLGEMNRAQAHEFLAQAYNLDPDQLQQQPQLWARVAMWLCRSYALNQQPKQALTYCQSALDLDPQPAYMETRALVESLVKEQQPYDDAILTKLRHELTD